MTELKTYLPLSEVERSRDTSSLVRTRDFDVDWREWEQHVFFGSAQARLNSAVEYIRTTFPFDGSQKELNEWRDNLNGWQNWLLNESWVYNLRSVNFDQTTVSTSETDPTKPQNIPAIYTLDLEALKREGVSDNDKKVVNRLNPKDKAFSIEFWFKASEGLLGVSAISSHKNIDGEGWTILFERLVDGVSFGGCLSVTLGPFATNYALSRAFSEELFEYDVWHHVNVSWTSASDGRELRVVVNGNVTDLTGIENELLMTTGVWASENIDPHWLGWSSSPQLNSSGDIVPGLGIQTFGGFQIDEYRLWHKSLTLREIEVNRFKNVWKQDDLVLQYRFNDSPETTLNFQGQPLLGVLDSSGNSLHGQRQPGTFGSVPAGQQFQPQLLRDAPEGLRERQVDSPSIYPLDTILNATLNALLETAKDYDESNPNLITKLVPNHYFDNPLGLPRTQIQDELLIEGEDGAFLLAALLYTWADFWDDLKLKGDTLISALHLNVDGSGSARPLLPVIAKELGITLPMIFEEVVPEFWDEEYEQIQESVWRRVLSIMPQILKRKGTLSGIRTLFNAAGTWQIDGAIRLREFGYQSSTIAESKREIDQQLRFVKTDDPPVIRFVRSRLAD